MSSKALHGNPDYQLRDPLNERSILQGQRRRLQYVRRVVVVKSVVLLLESA